MYQIYPICLKISTNDFARVLPKSRARFFVAAWIFTAGGTVLRAYRQRWQTKPQRFPKKIPARETYSPPPFIIDSRKILK